MKYHLIFPPPCLSLTVRPSLLSFLSVCPSVSLLYLFACLFVGRSVFPPSLNIFFCFFPHFTCFYVKTNKQTEKQTNKQTNKTTTTLQPHLCGVCAHARARARMCVCVCVCVFKSDSSEQKQIICVQGAMLKQGHT